MSRLPKGQCLPPICSWDKEYCLTPKLQDTGPHSTLHALKHPWMGAGGNLRLGEGFTSLRIKPGGKKEISALLAGCLGWQQGREVLALAQGDRAAPGAASALRTELSASERAPFFAMPH